jgi:two-component system, OmpR family, response regulator
LTVQPHILVVDDSRDIRELLVRDLEQNGFRASAAPGADQARRMLKTSVFDLAVLDVMMPGEDGLSLCRSLHFDSDLPVIMLTARGEDVDRILGLEMGADDYIAKPFNPRELVARIGAVLRRTNSMPKRGAVARSGQIQFDRWSLDTAQRELSGPDGTIVPLSSGEFRLLLAFIERPNVSLSRDQLLDITRGRNAEPFDRSIDNAVSRLRRKIEEDPKAPRLIKTVWGGGYVFTATISER